MVLKRVSISFLAMILFWCVCGYSENSFIEAQCLTFGSWGVDSLAWIDNQVFIAHGYWTNDDDYYDSWEPTNYMVSLVNLDNGQNRMCDKSLPGPLYLVSDNEIIYVLIEDISDVSDSYISSIKLYRINDYCKPVFEMNLEQRMLDCLVFNEIVYIATRDRILMYDGNSDVQTIYMARNEIQSSIDREHMMVENDYLYFLDGYEICRLDLLSLSIDPLAKTDIINLTDYNHSYVVLNDVLYYWNDSMKATVALDINRHQSRVLSDKRYLFIQYYEGGIVIFEQNGINTQYWPAFSKEVLYCPNGMIKWIELEESVFAPNATNSQLIVNIPDSSGELRTPLMICSNNVLFHNPDHTSFSMQTFVNVKHSCVDTHP